MNDRANEIAAIVYKHRERHGALLSILEAVQRTNEHNYLPKQELVMVAKEYIQKNIAVLAENLRIQKCKVFSFLL